MKRSGPLARRIGLRRKTWLRSVSRTKKYRRRDRDWDFMAYVLWLPCELRNVLGAGRCQGRVQADHAGQRPFGQKSQDDTCIPLCEKHHTNRTDYRGYFKNWTGVQMREWNDRVIHVTQGRYHHLCELRQWPWRTEEMRN
jgi:hypothetical protein